VLSVTGSTAQVRFPVGGADDMRATVGKFLGIRAEKALVIGVITKIAVEPKGGAGLAREDSRSARSTCSARFKGDDSGAPFFQRGVTE